MSNHRIAIVTDDPGWHGDQLSDAFAARSLHSTTVSLADCRFDLSKAAADILLPGFGSALPCGVFVRGVPGGTLEQVILRLDVLHCLRETGVVVYNDARGIERTVDKAMTSFLLKRAGIPTPDTWVCESAHDAKAVLMRAAGQGAGVVMKPLFGCQGSGLTLLTGVPDLPEQEDYGGVYYLQSFIHGIDSDWRDWRVFVIGGRAEAAMLRRADHWITNRARGAVCQAVALDPVITSLAEAAVRTVEVDYAGVDLVRDRRGQFLVTEVNSIPAWRGLQSVCSVNIAERIVDHFLSRVAAAGNLEALS